jgi:hypothetical protein
VEAIVERMTGRRGVGVEAGFERLRGFAAAKANAFKE